MDPPDESARPTRDAAAHRASIVAAAIGAPGVLLAAFVVRELWVVAGEMLFWFGLAGAVALVPTLLLAAVLGIPALVVSRRRSLGRGGWVLTAGIVGYAAFGVELASCVAGLVESPRSFLVTALRPPRVTTLARFPWPVFFHDALPAGDGFLLDGRVLAAREKAWERGMRDLFVVDPKTGAYRGFRVPEPPHEGALEEPVWSPAKRALLFAHGSARGSEARLEIFAVSSDASLERLAERAEGAGYGSCVALEDGERYACRHIEGAGDARRLVVRVARITDDAAPRSRAVPLATSAPDPAFRLSPDGEVLAWANRCPDRRGACVMQARMAGGESEVGVPLVPGAEEGEVHAIAWSPDGGRLAAIRGGVVVVSAAAGREAHAVLLPAPTAGVRHDGAHAIAWSPDGTRLAVVSDLDGACSTTNGYVSIHSCSTEVFVASVDDGEVVKLSTRIGEPGPVWWVGAP